MQLLAALPLIYSSGGGGAGGGEKDGICVFGKREGEEGGKKTWHARNNLSSPQETNLFERAAGLKIGGSPKTMQLELIARILSEGEETPERQSLYSVLFPYVCYGNIRPVYYSSCRFCFWSRFLGCRNTTESQSLPSGGGGGSGSGGGAPAASFDRM